jgi:dTDP-4-dehydrorhamnose reductase
VILKKLMIIGGSGLLGGHLAQFAKGEYEVVGTYHNHIFELPKIRALQMDITDSQKTMDIIGREKPDYIVLSAAQRNVDYCETHQEEASRINVEGAKNVAVASNKVQAKLIYLSTDLVFDGSLGTYKESDETNTVNHYGRTKLQGELEIANNISDYAIARVSVLYDWNIFDYTFNFVEWIHQNLKLGKPLSLFSDQFRCATYIKNACSALLKICENDENGIFHVAGKNCVSRHEIGLKVAEVFGFNSELISEMESTESEWVAVRPKKCCLDVIKMENVLGVKSDTIEEGLFKMKEEQEKT